MASGTLLVESVAACGRYDPDQLRGASYDKAIADLKQVVDPETGDPKVLEALLIIEDVFARHTLPTEHLTEIIKGL